MRILTCLPVDTKKDSTVDMMLRVTQAQFDLLILKELKLVDNKEVLSLYKMIKSPDKENLVVAEEIIKNKLNK